MQHSQAFEKLVAEVKPRIKEVAVDKVHEKQSDNDSFYFIDVREDHEWQKGHCTGAIHLGRGIIERDIEIQIADRDAEIILYCGGGYRSALAADMIQKMGYSNVFSMAGGIRAWRAHGYPEEKTG